MKLLNKLYNEIPFSLGWGLLVLVTINLSAHVSKWNDWQEVLWYCNFAALLLSFGLILKSRILINSVLISSIPVQFFWILDFFLSLFGAGLGRTAWLFSDAGVFIFMLSTLFHSALIPMSIWGSHKVGLSKKSFLFTLVVFSIMMFGTYIFTDYRENRNCVFYPCDIIYYEDPYVVLGSGEYLSWGYFSKDLLTWYAIFSFSYLFWQRKFKKKEMLFE